MTIACLLIANRGEIAIRIARAAAEIGIRTIGVFSQDDTQSLHVRRMDAVVALHGSGAAPYLDIGQIMAAARESGCDAVHPGYGFLAGNADFARACAEAGLTFVGPAADTLDLLGEKVAARALARSCNGPVAAGTEGATTLVQAQVFLSTHGSAMIKAVAGGGGRGMRVVGSPQDLPDAFAQCRAEALAAFGNDAVYLEALV